MRLAAFVLALIFVTVLAVASPLSDQPRLPDDMRAIAQKALRDLGAGRYEAAATGFQNIIDRHPDSLYGWTNLGIVRSNQGREEEAVAAFQHAAQLNPSDAFVLTDLGMSLCHQGKYRAAIRPFERAEKLNPENSNLHAYLAECYARAGRDDDAARERSVESQQRPEMAE